MGSLTFRRVFASSGLVALCGCSLVFDPSDLGRGSPQMPDAWSEVDAREGGVDGEAEAAGDAGGGNANTDAAVDASTDVPSGDAPVDDGSDVGALDADNEGGRLDAAPTDAGADGDNDALGGGDAAGPDAGTLAASLVVYYPFDETGGTTVADISGNGSSATMRGATFATGLRGNAATFNGTAQYVSLPYGVVSGLTTYSISEWVYPNTAAQHTHIFDFGTGTNTYMFLTPGTTVLQFAITTSGVPAEQRLNATSFATGRWQHVAITLTGVTGTLYANGVQVAQNTAMTQNPASLGNTTQNWLGRSQDSVDPYFNGQIDEFRIYNRALSASEVQEIFMRR